MKSSVAVCSPIRRARSACSICPSANEPGFQVRASVYAVNVEGAIAPQAEIAEVVWIDPSAALDIQLAPLTRDHVLPLARVA